MPDWRSISAAARDARALLIRDAEGGEAKFDTLLAAHRRDPMILLERGKAWAALGETTRAVQDLQEAARRFPMERYRQLAQAELAKVGGSAGEESVQVAEATLHHPSRAELLHANAIFHKREHRAVDYQVATRLLKDALSGDYGLSPAVPAALLLHSWNFAYYQDGRVFDVDHYEKLHNQLAKHHQSLDAFRKRDLTSWTGSDEVTTLAIVGDLSEAVGRVGAVKVMHLWAPEFFPLWDNPIANAYGFDLRQPGQQYCRFIDCVRLQLPLLEPPAGVSALKSLDEFNYCRFSKGWM